MASESGDRLKRAWLFGQARSPSQEGTMTHRKGCRALPRDFNHHQRCEVWEDNIKCPRRALYTATYRKRRVIMCQRHKNAMRDQLKDVVKEIK